MKQVFLKFPDDKTGTTFLADYLKDGEVADPANYAIDVIGAISEISGEFPNLTSTKLDGWHVNMLVPDDFTTIYQVTPKTARRVFAGWDK